MKILSKFQGSELVKMCTELPDKDINEHIARAIKYYVSLDYEGGPGYAIMISGDWGTGKTHTVGKILKELNTKHIWVSLYGLSDGSQIDYEIYRQMHPILSSKKGRLFGKVAKGLLKGTLKIDLDGDGSAEATSSPTIPELEMSEMSDPENAALLVFDDLERSNFDKPELILGYINSFVEHNNIKSIVIGNDKKYEEQNKNYIDVKEKLIGNTYEIKPDIKNAVKTITSNFQGEIGEFIRDNSNLISSFCITFKGGNSLDDVNFRCLNRSLIDYAQVHQDLDKSITSQVESITQFFRLYLFLSYFTKVGKFGKTELNQIADLSSLLGEDPPPIAHQLLKQWEIERSQVEYFVPMSDWIEALVEGDPRNLVENLKNSSAFQSAEQEISWVTVWHGLERDKDLFESAVLKLEKEIEQREYRTRGEILHLIGLSIWLRDTVYPSSDPSQSERHEKWQCIFDNWESYVQEVQEDVLITLDDHFFGSSELGFYGLGINNRDTEEFQNLEKQIYSVATDQLLSKISKRVHALAKKIPDNYSEFYNAVCSTNNPGESYPNIPVLDRIDPNEFAGYLFSTPAENFRKSLMFFKVRYGRGSLKDLEPEFRWFEEVVELIEKKRDSLTGIEFQQINNGIECYIIPAKQKWREHFGKANPTS